MITDRSRLIMHLHDVHGGYPAGHDFFLVGTDRIQAEHARKHERDCGHQHDTVTIPREHLAALIEAAGTGDDMTSWDVANWFESVYVPAVVTKEECAAAFTRISEEHHSPNVVIARADHTEKCTPCAEAMRKWKEAGKL